MLIEAGVDVNSQGATPPLVTRIMDDDIDAVNLLLRHGANVNVDSYFPPIHLAVILGKPEIVKALLAAGANPNHALAHTELATSHSWNMDHVTTDCRKREMLETLDVMVAAGMDLDQRNNHGKNALHVAASYPRPETMAALLKHRPDLVDIPSDVGYTPLLYAAGIENVVRHAPPPVDREDSFLATVKACLAAGAHPNGSFGNLTPLHVAAECRMPKVVVELLRAGACPSMRNAAGAKPRIKEMPEVADALRELRKCATCGAATTRHCSRCRTAYYCDRACQDRGWARHKPNCKTLNISIVKQSP